MSPLTQNNTELGEQPLSDAPAVITQQHLKGLGKQAKDRSTWQKRSLLLGLVNRAKQTRSEKRHEPSPCVRASLRHDPRAVSGSESLLTLSPATTLALRALPARPTSAMPAGFLASSSLRCSIQAVYLARAKCGSRRRPRRATWPHAAVGTCARGTWS